MLGPVYSATLNIEAKRSERLLKRGTSPFSHSLYCVLGLIFGLAWLSESP